MIPTDFTPEDIDALRHERFHHPHPRVQEKMEAVYPKSQGLLHKDVCRLSRISERLPFTGVVAVPVLRSERVRVHSPMKWPLTLHLAISGHHPLRAAWSAAFVVDVVTGASPSGLPGPTGPCT
jgi:hypothetical protein